MQNQKWMTWAIIGFALFFFLSFAMPFGGWGHADWGHGGWEQGGWNHVGDWEAMRTGAETGGAMHRFGHGGWGFGPFGLLIGVASIFFRLGLLVLMLFGVFLFWQKANGSLDASNHAQK